jgi:molybdenum cofactor cytidylyltransferase
MIAGIVLAAGASLRFGAQKMLAPLAGKPLVRWTVEQVCASRVDEVLVVVGREADAVRAALVGLPVRFVDNPRYGLGMSTSVRAGVLALSPLTEAVIIVLGDQPSVTAGIIDQLIDHRRTAGGRIIAPTYDGVRGNPVLFDASLLPDLLSIGGDIGARAIIARHPELVSSVPFAFPMPRDVDEPDDLARLDRESPLGRPVRRTPQGARE